jgi:endo-1,4-beta-xylanase
MSLQKTSLTKTLKDFSGLGLTMQVTELDISVYPKEHNARDRKAEDNDTVFSAEKELKQIEVYKTCFDLLRNT